MKNYIRELCAEYDYPAGSADVFCEAWDKIMACPAASEVFCKYISAYENGEKLNHPKMLEEVRGAAGAADVHIYTAELLIYICLSHHLRKMYQMRGLSYDMFSGVAIDMRCKLIECQKVKGITGSFVAFWFDRFFDMTRFALGRLQFETYVYRGPDIDEGAVKIPDGMNVLSVHIPSSGPLYYDKVLDSYKQAEKFYGDMFKDGKMIVACHSWLMYRPLLDFLPEKSRVRSFISDFQLVSQHEDPGFMDCWRLFDVDYSGGAASLPRDSSLRRAYAEWLDGGGIPGFGLGVLVIENGKIITHI